MKAIDRLKRDHKLLRSKLDILESALAMGPRTWFVLREVCYTLSRQLSNHIRREEELVAACRKALTAEQLARMEVEHHDEPQLLRSVNRLFVQEQGEALEQIRPALTELIRGLRHHMDDEEATLFPTLEQVLGSREEAEAAVQPTPGGLDETMTINRVLHEHPNARSVFERLFINIPYEGCTCLDEVAWCHGVESRDLLAQLEQAIASQAASETPQKRPARQKTPSLGTKTSEHGGRT